MPNKIIIGRIGRPYGLQGWTKVQSFTEIPSHICTYVQGWLQLPSQTNWQPYQANIKQAYNNILFKFAHYDTPETARKLTGSILAIERDLLPKLADDEYYWSDLEGLKVFNQDGVYFGKIEYLIATGANDVMVVKDKEKSTERLIPYITTVVNKVDLKHQELQVDWDTEF